jgi:23S rRNA pseudouridine1911/1915/1917 synthase
VGRSEAPVLLVRFLAARLGLSGKKAKALLDGRHVFVNRRRVWMAHHELQTGDRVEVPRAAPRKPVDLRTRTLFEDDHYVVINKPAGTLANGEGSIEELLRTRLRCPALAAAHRLDRDTSGCLLLAKTPGSLEGAVRLFRERRVRKRYHAIVHGALEGKEQTIKTPLNGQEAVTRIRLLDARKAASHLQVAIDTGRTHQIRKHLASIRHPVIGDRYYGIRLPATRQSITVGRQMLHASSLDFEHPVTGRRVRAKAPLPRDFRQCLRSFRLT